MLEMVVYIPGLVIALLLGFRHGFGRSAGWYFFILFSLARLIGNGCYLGTINSPDNENLYIAYGVCNAIGLSPLIMGLLAAQSRVNDSIYRKTGSAYWPMIFRIISLGALVAMILSIVGMTTASSLTGGLDNPKTKAGMIIYIVILATVLVLTFLLWVRYSGIEQGEHRLLWAITVALPFLVIRMIYSVLAIFKHDNSFNMFTGNTTIFLVMDVLMEIIIVYIVLITGLTLQAREKVVYDPSKERGQAAGGLYDNVEMQQQPQTVDGSGQAGPRYKKRPYRGGPIMMLITWIINTVNERRQ